jgi:hypothetical protein
MSTIRFKESFPGSGITEEGIRINPNMPDYGKSPCVIRGVAEAKAAWEDHGLKLIYQSCMKKEAAQKKRSHFRRICFSIKEEIYERATY